MKILVTGIAGFIGSHIADELLRLGHEVVGLDNMSNGKEENIEHFSKKVYLIKGNVTDKNTVDRALNGVQAVCHQAALRSVPLSVKYPRLYYNNNVIGSMNLFEQAHQRGIKKIVCASSSSVYGDTLQFPVSENQETKPISPYAATKLLVEHVSEYYSRVHGMDIVNLRYFNVFGPRQSMDDEYSVVIPIFINKMLDNQQPTIYGDGSQRRDFVFIKDVVDANVKALLTETPTGIYNVASGDIVGVTELFFILRNIIGVDVDAIYAKAREGDVLKTHADISEIKKVLGWKPKYELRGALRETVKWWQGERK